jgi:tetratricopeptide (TPR) repeat protein
MRGLQVAAVAFIMIRAASPFSARAQTSGREIDRALGAAISVVENLKTDEHKARLFAAIGSIRATSENADAAVSDFDRAVQYADSLTETYSKVYLLEDIAAAQAGAGDRRRAATTLKHALEVADSHTEAFRRAEARMWLVRTQVKVGDMEGAYQNVARVSESGSFRARALRNLTEAVRTDKALFERELPRIRAVAENLPDDFERAVALCGIGTALADNGDIERALSVESLLDKGAQQYGNLDARGVAYLGSQGRTLSAIAKAQAKAKSPIVSRETFEKAIRCNDTLPPEGEGLRSSRLGTIAKDQAEAGDFAGAAATVEGIVYEYHRAVAICALAEAQAKSADRAVALSNFTQAVRTALKIHVRDNRRDRPGSYYLQISDCLSVIVSSLAGAGFFDEALDVVDSISDPRHKDSTLSLVASAVARNKDYVRSNEIAGRIADSNSKELALRRIAEARTEAGDVGGALDWALSLTSPESKAMGVLGIIEALARRASAGDAAAKP